jgi:adenylate cyclase
MEMTLKQLIDETQWHKDRLDEIFRSRSWKLAKLISSPMRLLRKLKTIIRM